MFESVDLPAPFSPSSACTSPSAASKWTPSFATTPGKPLGDVAEFDGGGHRKRAGGADSPARPSAV